MGLETVCACESPFGTVEVKALLETHELILRGALKRRFPIGQIERVMARDGALRFDVAGETYALALGAAVAQRWAAKMARPPPSLRDKLGIGPAAPALAIGTVTDPALRAALAGVTAPADRARLSVAVVESFTALEAALAAHARLPDAAAIWIVHGKGPGAAFGEAAVRGAMRGRGFIDSKSCAVSQTLSATRYARSKRT